MVFILDGMSSLDQRDFPDLGLLRAILVANIGHSDDAFVFGRRDAVEHISKDESC